MNGVVTLRCVFLVVLSPLGLKMVKMLECGFISVVGLLLIVGVEATVVRSVDIGGQAEN